MAFSNFIFNKISKNICTQGECHYCLFKEKRKNTGIPICDKLIEAKRKIVPEDIL